MGRDSEQELGKTSSGGNDSIPSTGILPPRLYFLTQSIRNGSRDPYKFLERGTLFAKDARYEDALADFDKAVELNPSFVEALLWRAHLHYLLKNPEQARQDFERIGSIDPAVLRSAPEPTSVEEILRVYVTCAQNRYVAKDYEGSLECLEALRKIPTAFQRLSRPLYHIHMTLGAIYRKQGDLKLALEHFARAKSYNPRATEPNVMRAEIYYDQEYWRQAERELKIAHNLGPRDRRILLFRARVLQCAGDNAGALKDYNRVLKLDPNYADVLLLRAELYAANEQYLKAGADLREYFRKMDKSNLQEVEAIRARVDEIELLKVEQRNQQRTKLPLRQKVARRPKPLLGICKHGIDAQKCDFCASWAPDTYFIRWDD